MSIMQVFTAGVVVYALVSMSCLDAKRLVAFSTAWHVCVLSVLVVAVVHVAMVHIVVHALFKAALFVIIGSILHCVGSQDARTMVSVGHHGCRLVWCVWCVYCSIGWCYSAVFVTKKVLVDLL
jgi:NADH:ubiquinone oxidoreductase subunit 5 (subunit L)/multisubunit Na+/H+ antiporter MnhA subunit